MPKTSKLIQDLELYRLENKIPQEELGELLGVHFGTINRWLRGHIKPRPINEYAIRKLIYKGAGK